MRIPRFLTLLLLFLATSSPAQERAEYRSIPVVYTLSFVRGDSSFCKNSNEILKEIAADRVLNLRDTRFVLKFTAMFRDTVGPGGANYLACTFSPPEISGNVQYRDFDLGPVLAPNRVMVDIGLYHPGDSSFFMLVEASHAPWPGSAQPLITTRPTPGESGSSLPELRNLRLYHDEDGWNRFVAAMELIDDYYAVSAVLDSLGGVLNQCRYEELYTEAGWYIRLAEAGWILKLIRDRNLPVRLNLDAYDPLKVAVRLEETWKQFLSLAMTYRQRFHGSPALNDPANQERLLRQFIGIQERYIRWSMLVKERNSSLYGEYLEQCFTIPVFGDDSLFIRQILREIFPDIPVDSACALVSGRIMEAYRAEATRLSGAGRDAESIELIENGKQFGASAPCLPAGSHDVQALEAAAGGIYTSLLAIAADALHRNRFAFAESYLQRAIDYRKRHPGLTFPDSLHRNLIRRILSARMAECDTLREREAFEEALSCYSAIQQTSDSMTRYLLQVDLGQRMAECRYHLVRRDGISRFELRDFTDAGRCFQECMNLRIRWHLPADTLLDSLHRRTYAWYLAGLIRDQEALIWRDDLTGALRFADSLQNFSGKERIPDDSVVKSGLESYRRKIATRSCYRKKEAADVYCYRAWLHLEKQRFARGGALLDSALWVLNGTGTCGYDTRAIRDSLLKYESPIRFQQLVQTIEQNRIAQLYDTVIVLYERAARFFDNKRVSRFGLSCDSLYHYVYGNENGMLTASALRFYLARNEPDEALRYLEMLRLQAVPEKSGKEEIHRLASMLAERDYSRWPENDPAVLVENYTGQRPGYSKLRFYYLYRWNELRNTDSLNRK